DRLQAVSDIEFKRITISYLLTAGLTNVLVDLNNSNLTEVTSNDLFDQTFDRDIINLNHQSIDIHAIYGLSDFRDNEAIYYNSELVPLLMTYNIYYLKNIGIALLILMPITYFIFFHRYVMEKINTRRNQKKAEKEEKLA